MQIRDEHLYHGSALNQIAEHDSFTAINTLTVKNKKSRSSFRINDSIAVYFKYCTKPAGGFLEYIFTFNNSHLRELHDIEMIGDKLYLALICVEDRQICCIPNSELTDMINERKKDAGQKEDQYQVLVTLKKGSAFRVYMNKHNSPGKRLKKLLKVPRNNFPNALFE